MFVFIFTFLFTLGVCTHICIFTYYNVYMYQKFASLFICIFTYYNVLVWYVPKICIFISMLGLKNILGLAFSFASILIPEVDYLNYFKSICYGFLTNGFLLFLTNIKQT